MDEVLKIDKEIEQLNEPSDEIPMEIKQPFNKNLSGEVGENYFINNNQSGYNRAMNNNNKFGYSNNQQNLNNMQLRNARKQNERIDKGRNDKDCIIF